MFDIKKENLKLLRKSEGVEEEIKELEEAMHSGIELASKQILIYLFRVRRRRVWRLRVTKIK